jgi:tripartite-type tricarboxylate transporter receptor subunit TctC
MRSLKSLCFGSILAGLAAVGAVAQEGADFPIRPIRILVPFAAGGPTDVIMRVLGDELRGRFGTAVIIENRPGAGTIVATAAAAKAAPDGYTLGVATNSFVINPAINHALPYDTFADFAPVGMVMTAPVVLVANKDFSADTLAEAVALIKQSAAPVNYTSPGPRGVGHFAGEMLKQAAGITMQHISYNGSAPALLDVIAGRVPLMFDLWNSVRDHVALGRIKLIAAAGANRLAEAPQTETIAETYPGFDVRAFGALIAPAGVPSPILYKLATELEAVVASPQFADKVKPLGVTPLAMGPHELDAMFRKEVARWSDIAKAANIQVE